MPEATGNGVTIYYETEGDPEGSPLLIVMGLGAQMTAWYPEFRSGLCDRGFHVISFDNRDVGRSTWFDDAGPPDVVGALAGTAKAPYLLADMAADAVSVLDTVGLESAHILGASMGGMIVQSMAIGFPGRVRTMTSIMSTTGDRGVGLPHPDVMPLLLQPAPTDKKSAVDQGMATSRAIASPGFPFEEERIREHIAADYDRAFHPEGTGRQLVAIMSSPDRTRDLEKLDLPTLVIHGEADPLVDVSGGRATAAAIPGAELVIIPGMGHDLPSPLYDRVADSVAALAGRS